MTIESGNSLWNALNLAYAHHQQGRVGPRLGDATTPAKPLGTHLVVCAVGAGGKTSSLCRLASEAWQSGQRCIITTTTHLQSIMEGPFPHNCGLCVFSQCGLPIMQASHNREAGAYFSNVDISGCGAKPAVPGNSGKVDACASCLEGGMEKMPPIPGIYTSAKIFAALSEYFACTTSVTAPLVVASKATGLEGDFVTANGAEFLKLADMQDSSLPLKNKQSNIHGYTAHNGRREHFMRAKLKGVHSDWVEPLSCCCDLLLVEADGARGLSIKAPASHEPVLPKNADVVLGCIGLDTLRKTISQENVHRLDEFCAVTSSCPGERINAEMVLNLVSSKEGLFKMCPRGATRIVLLNKLEMVSKAVAFQLAEKILLGKCADSVMVTSLIRGGREYSPQDEIYCCC